MKACIMIRCVVNIAVLVCLVTFVRPIPVPSNGSLPGLTEESVHEKVTDYNKSRFANIKLAHLNASLIKPPDHLEGLPMERNGHLNPQYRKEVLLGTESSKQQGDEALLRTVFAKVDINNDGHLTISELENWIAAKVKEHYTQAVRDNFWIFSALDKNHDGRVSWEEYHVNFMIEKGFDDKYAKNHPEDHKTLDRDLKEKILLDKAMWFEAANSDPDALNIDEFLTFRHPEHSHVSLIKMVNDIISNLDENGDEQLSEDEFSQLGPDEMKRTAKEEWKKERIQEFRQNIDLNGDGQASRQELLMYNDPENPIHARSEARELVQQADNDGDNQLSLEEVLSQKDVFLGSKMVNTAKNIHDEF
ncbi:45 kDa calcium-binding protein [Rhipicephalus sanguineus]|uniref:45 kDa calcium-binding protein n=1 Tax=Rhipicephalus sanguineus TaxID=34632 RepID=UPI00189545C1|nr:45 kDa calcium-binding protein [Rhipicephalus sanguineus]